MRRSNKHETMIRDAIKLLDNEEYNNARKVLNSLLEDYGPDPVVYGLTANSYVLQENYKAATQPFERVLLLNPNSESALAGLFHCLNECGRFDEAMKRLFEFLRNVNSLTKENIIWILSDLMEDIDNPILAEYRDDLKYFAGLHGIAKS